MFIVKPITSEPSPSGAVCLITMTLLELETDGGLETINMASLAGLRNGLHE